MKDLLKTYAPLVALLVGFLCYWQWQQVKNLREQTALLVEEKNAMMQVLSNQCTVVLEQQGFEVVRKPPEPPPAQGDDSGEDTR